VNDIDLGKLADSMLDTAAQRLVNAIEGCLHKEPEELTELEQTALAIFAGANYEFTETGMRVTDLIAITKRDGRFIVNTKKTTPTAGDAKP
jgi:hypothetical protein